jgi:O-methyltransferase involved in polyketide biosynthesis
MPAFPCGVRPFFSDILNLVGSCAPGSAIAFDYAVARFVNGDHDSYGGRQVARWLRKIGEPFRFGLDPVDTRGFLQARGLTLLSDWGPEQSEHAYLARHDGGRPGRTLGHVRFAHAQVPVVATGVT